LKNKWQLTGLFDFGMAAPSTPEREARHVLLLGRYVAREALAVIYNDPEPILGQFNNVLAEDLANFWGYAQMIISGIWRQRFGLPLGSVPMKIDALFNKHFQLSEILNK
jgi:hypothetical protein